MKHNLKFGLLLFLIIWIIGCKNNPAAPNGALEFFPLTVGDTWYYRITDRLPDSLGGTTTKYQAMLVDWDSTFDGKKWYYLIGEFDYFSLLSNMTEGIWGIPPSGGKKVLIYKYPCSVGEVYSQDSTRFMKSYSKNISINEPITIDGKQYQTYHYQFYYQTLDTVTKNILRRDTTQEAFISPMIGVVKYIQHIPRITYNNTPTPDTLHETMTYELTDYSLK
jgi:hypothetical protein